MNSLIVTEVHEIIDKNMKRNPQLLNHIKEGDEQFLKAYCCGLVTQFIARNNIIISEKDHESL